MANLTLKIEKYDDGSESHYDSNGNKIYHKNYKGFEDWKEYDENNNLIHYNSDGFEEWYEYDENNNLIHHRYSDGFEVWYEYDENNNPTYCKNSRGNEYVYINNKKVSKEQWEKYYKKHTLILDGKKVQISNESFKAMKKLFSK